jgi:hypothetical protein
MATKNQNQDLTEDWWDILMLSPHASVRDIHQAYEMLRMSYLPIKRDRSIPVSPETTEHLQKLDRAFRLALDSKNPNASLTKKAANKSSTKATPRPSTNEKDPFQSVVQDWAKTSAQSPSPTNSGTTANSQSGSSSPSTGNTQHTNPTKKKSAASDTKSSKKGGSGYWLLFLFIVCGIGGYLFGSGSTPTTSNTSRNSSSAPPPRAAPNNVPAQAPPPQSNPAPTGADPFVVALQQELNRRGFNAGAVDGLIGPQTYNAITAAQRAYDMLVDGVPTEALLRALRRK